MSGCKGYFYQALSTLIVLITMISLGFGCSPAPAGNAVDDPITAQTKKLYASVDMKSIIEPKWVDSVTETRYGKDIVINGVKSTFHDGAAYRHPGVMPMLEVSGDHYEMGLQYGVLMRPEIFAAVEGWGKQMSSQYDNSGMARAAAYGGMRNLTPIILKKLPQRVLDLMQGIADGSGIPVDTIQAFSIFFDLGQAYRSTACSGVLLKGANGTVFHARVQDVGAGGGMVHGNLHFIVRYKPTGYNALTCITYPGCLEFIQGINDKGLTYGSNSMAVRKVNSQGFPTDIVAFVMFEECSNLADAEKYLTTHLPLNGLNATIGDQQAGTGAVYEVSPTNWAKRELKDNNPVWVFNNFTDPKMVPEQVASRSMSFDSGWGDFNNDRWKVASTFAIKNEYTIDDAIDAMQMSKGPEGADYAWSGTRQGICNLTTVLFVTYDPQGKGIYCSQGPYFSSRGDIYYVDNDFSKAPVLYRKAIGIDKATEDYARVYQSVSLTRDKLKGYADLASQYPDDAQMQFMTGYNAFLQKQADKYAVYFEKAYALKPDNAEYKLFAGLAALATKNNDKAISLLEDIKSSDIYTAEDLYRLIALQKAWADKDPQKASQYKDQVTQIIQKYDGQSVYQSRIFPLIDALGK